jgi:hypothetical protein
LGEPGGPAQPHGPFGQLLQPFGHRNPSRAGR